MPARTPKPTKSRTTTRRGRQRATDGGGDRRRTDPTRREGGSTVNRGVRSSAFVGASGRSETHALDLGGNLSFEEGVEDARARARATDMSAGGDADDAEGRRVMRSYPTPSTSLIVASCATLVLAATTTSREGAGRSGSVLDGARANAAGELGRERIWTDIPFEDDHVKMVVPRIEREIAAEELGGEVSWVRSAWDGTISASEASTTVAANAAAYAMLGKRHEESSSRGSGVFDLPAFETTHAHKKREHDEAKSLLENHDKQRENLASGASSSTSSSERASGDKGRTAVSPDAHERLWREPSETIDRAIRAAEEEYADFDAAGDGREEAAVTATAPLGMDEGNMTLSDRMEAEAKSKNFTKQGITSTVPESKLVNALESDSKDFVKDVRDDADAESLADVLDKEVSSARERKAEESKSKTAMSDSAVEAAVEKKEIVGDVATAAMAETPLRSEQPSGDASTLMEKMRAQSSSEGDASTLTTSYAANTMAPTPPTPKPLSTSSTDEGGVDYEAIKQSLHLSNNSPEGPDVSKAKLDAKPPIDSTASTGSREAKYKKTIDTTEDISLYEAAHRPDSDQPRSWAQKGLKPADKDILTARNIKKNEDMDKQPLSMEFLSKFPVHVPKSELETQNWEHFKLRSDEESDRETEERVTAAVVEVVRAEREEEEQSQRREHSSWTDALFSVYFMAPLGVAIFLSVFYVVVLIVARKSSKTRRSGDDNDGNMPGDAAAFAEIVGKSVRDKKHEEGFASSLMSLFSKPNDEHDLLEERNVGRLQRTLTVEETFSDTDEDFVRFSRSGTTYNSASVSGTSTPKPYDDDPAIDKNVINRTLQSIRVRELSSPERIRRVRSMAPSPSSSPTVAERENDDDAQPERRAAAATAPHPTEDDVDKLSKTTEPVAASAPAEAPTRAPQNATTVSPAPAKRAIFPPQDTPKPTSVAPRRPGDGPQIVRSMTTKFY